jgi:Zn-dependent alcohol dehydrogenase
MIKNTKKRKGDVKIMHRILIDQKVLTVYIRRCGECKSIQSIAFGKRAVLCMDCLKERDNAHLHVPRVLMKYSSKDIIKMMKEKTIEEFKITRRRRKMSKWQNIKDLDWR